MVRTSEMLPEYRLSGNQHERRKRSAQYRAEKFRKGKPRDNGRNRQQHPRAGTFPGLSVRFGKIPMFISVWGLIHFLDANFRG